MRRLERHVAVTWLSRSNMALVGLESVASSNRVAEHRTVASILHRNEHCWHEQRVFQISIRVGKSALY